MYKKKIKKESFVKKEDQLMKSFIKIQTIILTIYSKNTGDP